MNELHSSAQPRVVISGYYGFDNLGDELILKVLVDELKARQVSITVLSQNPEKTAQTYGVNAIKRTQPTGIIRALSQANLLISGGGGLFQDATGPMSTIYYGGLIHLAHFLKVPVMFWAQGVGPLNRPLSRSMTASALKRCARITVRDEKSAALVEMLTGNKPEITADPVWLLYTDSKKPITDETASFDSSALRIGISLRPWHELDEAKLAQLADCLNRLAEQHEGPVCFVMLPFQKKEDTELLEAFASQLKTGPHVSVELINPVDVLSAVKTCDRILGMRFHSLILGLLCNVPVYGLVYDPKVASLLTMFNLQGTTIHDLANLNPESLSRYFSYYPLIDLKTWQAQSRRNFSILEELLRFHR